jgi:hypothetical protein
MDMTSREPAAAEAHAAETSPGTAAASPPCVPPAACIESIDFAYGVMDLLVVVCGTLISRGVIEPNALQVDCSRYATLWRNEGRGSRAVAAEVFLDRLRKIEAAGRGSDSHIVNSTLTKTVN